MTNFDSLCHFCLHAIRRPLQHNFREEPEVSNGNHFLRFAVITLQSETGVYCVFPHYVLGEASSKVVLRKIVAIDLRHLEH